MNFHTIITANNMIMSREVRKNEILANRKGDAIKTINKQLFNNGMANITFDFKVFSEEITTRLDNINLAKEIGKDYEAKGYITNLKLYDESELEKICELSVQLP